MSDEKDGTSIEQVSSRPTKPDESRKKSMYFLLLAVGRQRAQKNSSLRIEYREALNSLEIEKLGECWSVTVNSSGKQINREIKRSDMRFYVTGLSEQNDKIHEANRKKANEFWLSIEEEISPQEISKKEILPSNFSLKRIKKIDSALILQLILILNIFVPSIFKTPMSLLLGLFPLIKFFWHSQYRNRMLFIYLAIVFTASFLTDFETRINPVQGNRQILLFVLVSCTVWSLVLMNYNQVISGLKIRAFAIIPFLILALYSIYILNLLNTVVITTFFILGSMVLQHLRKRSIENSTIVLFYTLIEVLASLFLIGFIIRLTLTELELSAAILSLWIASYLLWFLFFNMWRNFPIGFRFVYPILVLPISLLSMFAEDLAFFPLTPILTIAILEIFKKKQKSL